MTTGTGEDAPRGILHPATAARAEIREARRALKLPVDVHEARKRLKRSRALLRLCEAGETEAGVRELRHRLRDAGRELAFLRDREAALEALRELDGEARVPATVLAALRSSADVHAEGEAEVFSRLRRELRETGRSLARLPAAADARGWVEKLGHAYGRARRAYQDVLARPSGDALHTLRRRTKDLRYQMEWLMPVWPPILEAWVDELHALTDDLGRTQDVRVTRRALGDAASPVDRRRLALILWDLRRDARRARRSGLRRAARLFAENPGSFTRRMRALAEA